MFFMTNEILEKVLKDYLECWEKAKKDHGKIKDDKNSISSLWNDVRIASLKIGTLMEAYPCAVTVDKNDLFSLPKDHEIW